MALLAELPRRARAHPPGVIRAHDDAHFQLNKRQHAQSRLAFRVKNQAEIKIGLTDFSLTVWLSATCKTSSSQSQVPMISASAAAKLPPPAPAPSPR
jgi:hypothetical protein